ncbi:CitMHS family transporter [Acetonema longum]|uniref:Citrate transporter, CitM family protein n=1 Tax=Acetonema longum DSM 6540 TaxID=1009370 RepID=F7NFE0_9FIRM|nr:citrate:proton symporter [Acetonema longum]EGO65265.1 citrate transporter, CitM family protein [Acetonema longum DSM 6540]
MSLLAVVGFSMIIVFMYLLMTKRITAMNALILIPIIVAVGLGFGPSVGKMALNGIKSVAPTAVMIAFAMFYFSIMIDAGMFDPLMKKILQTVKGDPVKVIVGTTILAGLVSLDGDGPTTYIITTTAMMAVHKRLGIRPIILPTVAVMVVGVMNIVPWGGPTGRVMSALQLEASDVFIPLIPCMIAGAAWVLLWSYRLGIQERKRLGITASNANTAQFDALASAEAEMDEEAQKLKRPHLFWVNVIMTVVLMAALVVELMPLNVLFMIGTALASVINYGTNIKVQQDRICHYGQNIMLNVAMVLGAGIFSGIMGETKIIDAMANTLTQSIPPEFGSRIALITALSSLPFDYFLTNDAFYFGIVPLLAKYATNFDISAAEIARASLVAQGCHLLSPLVSSTYVLLGLTGATLDDLTRSALLPSIGTSVVMLVTALVLGIIPF